MYKGPEQTGHSSAKAQSKKARANQRKGASHDKRACAKAQKRERTKAQRKGTAEKAESIKGASMYPQRKEPVLAHNGGDVQIKIK